MIKTIIFDWDGTLHDTKHLYGCALRVVYQELVDKGYAPEHYYSDDDMAPFLGMPGPVMWKTFMPQLSEELRTQSSIRVGQEMSKAIPVHGKLYPGVVETLNQLKEAGYHMVILSNCRHIYLETHRNHWNLDQWFEGFYCSEDYGFIPKENIFPTIQETFPGPYVVIGDRDSDLAVSRMHKFPSIGCSYGFGSEEELSVASYIAGSVTELPGIIKTL